jgi:hypothetical protein
MQYKELTYFDELYKLNPTNVLSRYITKSYIDNIIPDVHTNYNTQCVVNMALYNKDLFPTLSNYPYWIKERAVSIIQFEDGRIETFIM